PDFFTKDDDTGTDLAEELKNIKKTMKDKKGRKSELAREDEIERRKQEMTKRDAPPDAIGATLRIKKEDIDKKEKEEAKKKKKAPPRDDFNFNSFAGSSPEQNVYEEEDPDLLTTIPIESAGEPPIKEEEEGVPEGRRRSKFRNAADGDSMSFEELTKSIDKVRKPQPQTLDQMIHELIRRQNALIRLLIDKKIISKQDFRDRLK
ncbi:MAG: hypothetical protein ACYS8W_14080, partial [Planctomycetota bacterium]